MSEPVDITKSNRFAKIKKYLSKKPPKKRLAIVSGVSAGVLIAGSFAAVTLIKDTTVLNDAPVIESTYVEPVAKIYSPLTGLPTTQQLAQRPVTAVMIENSIDARPQAGLDEAGVVFEAIAEGGITRFMAMFQESQPGKIGPIRSARPYYVEWAKGFDAAYAHSGGSGQALELIQTLGVKDLDHGKSASYFDRVSNRYAPHNVYTDMSRLDAFKDEKGYSQSKFEPFVRKIDSDDEDIKSIKNDTAVTVPDTRSPATSIEFDISSPLYNTSYTYNSEANDYSRIMAGRAHNDESTQKQISPAVVIGLITEYSIHPNRIHSIYRTTGVGKAMIFQDGKMQKATWSKKSANDPLAFIDLDNNPIELVRGQTWITAIPDGRISFTP